MPVQEAWLSPVAAPTACARSLFPYDLHGGHRDPRGVAKAPAPAHRGGHWPTSPGSRGLTPSSPRLAQPPASVSASGSAGGSRGSGSDTSLSAAMRRSQTCSSHSMRSALREGPGSPQQQDTRNNLLWRQYQRQEQVASARCLVSGLPVSTSRGRPAATGWRPASSANRSPSSVRSHAVSTGRARRAPERRRARSEVRRQRT